MKIINELVDKIVDLRFKNIRPIKKGPILKSEIKKLEVLSNLIYVMEVKQNAETDR